MRCNVRESDVPCNVVTLGSMGQKNLTIGSAVGVEEGRVEKMMEMGQARQGVVDETCCQWMIFKTCKGATHPKHEPSGLELEPHAGACDGQVCVTLRKMCVRRGVLSSCSIHPSTSYDRGPRGAMKIATCTCDDHDCCAPSWQTRPLLMEGKAGVTGVLSSAARRLPASVHPS